MAGAGVGVGAGSHISVVVHNGLSPIRMSVACWDTCGVTCCGMCVWMFTT